MKTMMCGWTESVPGQTCLVALLLIAAAQAQAPGTGAIAGRVFDPSGAVVTAATVSAVSEQTNWSRTVTTGSEGFFRVPLLPPGTYSLSVTANGFRTLMFRGVPVVVSETHVVDAKLELGAANAEVEVDSSLELVQTENIALGQVTDGQTILALPLANRNFTQILALNPGVVVELPNAGDLGKGTQNVSADGAKTTSNNFQFNGIDANNLSENSASGYQAEIGLAIPAPDTIEEFKVQTGMYDAGYGRGAGSNVDVISKTGSNSWHGGVWEFFRNDALNANDYFLKQNGQPRPILRQNQFGGMIGGPIQKNRTFFFASYQGTIQKDGVSSGAQSTALLPPLTNDRSAQALGKIFGGQAGAFGGTAVASDGSNISPVALALLNFKMANGSYAIPTPQTILPGGIGESAFSIPASFREDQFSVNLDHQLAAKDQLSSRYFYSRDPFTKPFSPFGATVPGWGTSETDRNHMFVLSETHIFNPNLINVARFGFMRFQGLASISQPIDASQVGMAPASDLPEIPGIQVVGSFSIGTGGQPFYYENTNSFIWQDTVSLTRGRHTLRMGGEAKRHELTLNVPFVQDGFLLFLSFPDFLLGQSGTQNGSGVSNVFSSTAAAGSFRKNQRYTDLAGFIQDDFRATPRLTLNAGIRYEFFGPPSDIHGALPTFDPAIAAHQVPSSGSFSGYVLPSNYTGPLPSGVVKSGTSGLWNPDYFDFGPRAGFAWRMLDSPTVVLRGGYGIYYDQLSGDLVEQTIGQPPFGFTQSFSGAQNAGATFQQPYVPALPPASSFPIFLPRCPANSQNPACPPSGLTFFAVGRNLQSPLVQQYDLNLQYEIAHDLLWQVGYVGSKTSRQAGCTQFNQAALASPKHPVNGQRDSTLENLGLRVPFEGIAGGSFICGTNFSSNYNSLQTGVTKKLTHGLNLQGSYTFSKNLDYTSGALSGGPSPLSAFLLSFLTNDQTDPRQAYGPSTFDRTHRFVLSFAYAPPRFSAGPQALRYALSQWEFSGVAVLQSGLPITVVDSSAGTIYGNLSGYSRAECTGANPASSGSLSSRLNDYFNPAAFSTAPKIGDGTGFGDCGVGILRGPDQRNLDFAVLRNFNVTEGSHLQFRAEFFNITNTPKFGLPVSDFSAGPAFGVISATVSNPRIVQLAMKYNF